MIVHHGDCLEVLRTLDAASLDSCVTDPPYHLIQGSRGGSPRVDGTGPFGRHKEGSKGFMGRTWDGGDIAFRPETWAEVLGVLKPGAQLVACGGTRTYHRLACAIEDAGFEIRDQLDWIYGSGFPKSHEISRPIDRAVFGRWCDDDELARGPVSHLAAYHEGEGTALKPAHEPIVLARKPLDGTVAANVLKHGCGALNIDGCRVESDERITTHSRGASEAFPKRPGERTVSESGRLTAQNDAATFGEERTGRWPPNVLHDGSEEVLEAFARFGESKDGVAGKRGGVGGITTAGLGGYEHEWGGYGGKGTAARFFPSLGFTPDELRFMYCAKANKADRAGSKHPTIKPVALMRWLCRLITPPGGVILDPFAGSGTTGQAAREEGFDAVLIEREAEYVADIQKRLAHAKPVQLGLVA